MLDIRLVREEPEWAASRIRVLESRIRDIYRAVELDVPWARPIPDEKDIDTEGFSVG